eukprot:TRINITY_DN1766_c0_g1_i1.p1 TRINITY_DN1766_c0_g1~~TRINITY_DN1766_c0_g1_i1.p1  ORF type:complete len:182 (-),score=26.41 TRINITY_DN1766_c0_g1_i1:164-709(-)
MLGGQYHIRAYPVNRMAKSSSIYELLQLRLAACIEHLQPEQVVDLWTKEKERELERELKLKELDMKEKELDLKYASMKEKQIAIEKELKLKELDLKYSKPSIAERELDLKTEEFHAKNPSTSRQVQTLRLVSQFGARGLLISIYKLGLLVTCIIIVAIYIYHTHNRLHKQDPITASIKAAE